MRIYSISSLVIAGLVAATIARAHIGFSGDRNFDTLVVGVPETATSRTVSGSFGWADGTDADYGDSHRNTYFRFVVGDGAGVSISVARNDKTDSRRGQRSRAGRRASHHLDEATCHPNKQAPSLSRRQEPVTSQ